MSAQHDPIARYLAASALAAALLAFAFAFAAWRRADDRAAEVERLASSIERLGALPSLGGPSPQLDLDE